MNRTRNRGLRPTSRHSLKQWNDSPTNLDGLDGYVAAVIEAHNEMAAEFYDSSY